MTGEIARPRVLAFDAAHSACSVTVAVGETVLSAKRIETVHGQAEALVPMIDATMRDAAVRPTELDLIATTIGPGSFTGIRVGLAAARGIALATGAPLIGVTGFEAVAAGVARSDLDRAGFLLISLESRREDLYIQLFDGSGEPAGEPAAVMPVALGEAVKAIIGARPLLIAGDAVQRTALALAKRPRTTVLGRSAPDALGVLRAALRRWRLGKKGDRPQPFYLRPPDVTMATVAQRTKQSRP